jgi:WD40 repeat protein
VRAKDAKEEEQEQRNERGDFEVDAEEGDQAGSTPSWIKTIDYMKPKGYVAPPNLNTVPSTNIEIEYVYGYRSYDTRNNLRYSTKGEAVYHTAGTGIVLNQAKNTMRTTTVHNDDITCLDSWKNLVVTGEMGRRPLIAVWDTDTMEVIVSFSKPLEKSISNVAFSPSGKYIAATSMSDNHEIAIYDVIKKELVATGNGPRSPIFALKFTQEEDKVVCGCAKEIVFANFSSGKGLKLERGIFGKVPIIPTYSLARVGGYMVSAMGNGNILLWKGNSCTKPLKEHNVAVTALT